MTGHGGRGEHPIAARNSLYPHTSALNAKCNEYLFFIEPVFYRKLAIIRYTNSCFE